MIPDDIAKAVASLIQPGMPVPSSAEMRQMVGELIAAERERCAKATRMPLGHALAILAEIHTRRDEVTGFVVMMGATPSSSHNDYVQAWESVRAAAGLPTQPAGGTG